MGPNAQTEVSKSSLILYYWRLNGNQTFEVLGVISLLILSSSEEVTVLCHYTMTLNNKISCRAISAASYVGLDTNLFAKWSIHIHLSQISKTSLNIDASVFIFTPYHTSMYKHIRKEKYIHSPPIGDSCSRLIDRRLLWLHASQTIPIFFKHIV